jgi:hypothetical protein
MKQLLFACLALLGATLTPAHALGTPYNSCGTMIQGVTCPLLFSDGTNPPWLLDNNGGFQLGDVVRVVGLADPGCFTFCQQGGCIAVSSITVCVTNFGTPFCAGDGSGTPCPCANNSAPGAGVGCLHSGGLGGMLRGLGVPSVSADTAVLQGSDMPNGPALYFQGTGQQAGGAGVAFGDGLLCAGGTLVRLGVKFNAAGASAWPGAGDPLLSVAGGVVAGDVRYYQSWYRDSTTPYCTAATFDLTNGLAVTWGS